MTTIVVNKPQFTGSNVASQFCENKLVHNPVLVWPIIYTESNTSVVYGQMVTLSFPKILVDNSDQVLVTVKPNGLIREIIASCRGLTPVTPACDTAAENIESAPAPEPPPAAGGTYAVLFILALLLEVNI